MLISYLQPQLNNLARGVNQSHSYCINHTNFSYFVDISAQVVISARYFWLFIGISEYFRTTAPPPPDLAYNVWRTKRKDFVGSVCLSSFISFSLAIFKQDNARLRVQCQEQEHSERKLSTPALTEDGIGTSSVKNLNQNDKIFGS